MAEENLDSKLNKDTNQASFEQNKDVNIDKINNDSANEEEINSDSSLEDKEYYYTDSDDEEFICETEEETDYIAEESKTTLDEIEGEGSKVEDEQTENIEKAEMVEEEEEAYVEEPPKDPAAPLDLSDSKEALREDFNLRPDQLAEVEQLWELYQNYTPAYTDIDRYITETELVYMLKCLLLMTYTPEQLQELIIFCVRPPHPLGHISYDQFLKIVTIRQRDFPIDEELRSALQVFDPEKTGLIDRDYFKEVLAKQGYKMPQKQLDNLIKEIDMSNDGTLGIEDIVGTMGIDLNKEDIMMLKSALNPPEEQETEEQNF